MPPSDRRVSLLRRLRLFALACATSSALLGSVALAASAAGAEDGDRRPPVLIERAGCNATSSTAADATAGGLPSSSVLTVTVRVPRTALLEIGAAGEVLAAATNTGCAPRTGDDIFVRTAEGDLAPGDPSLLGRAWVGDFREAGVFQPQD